MKKYINKNSIKLISINDEISLFFHTESLQIYPINNEKILNFLITYNVNGYSKTKELYNKEEFDTIYKFIEDKLASAPESKENNNINVEIERYKTIILPISAKCTLNCSYCFAQTDGGFKFEDFNESNIDKVASFIIDKNPDLDETITVIFFGGEPFLKLDLMTYTVKHFKEKYPSRKIKYSITTNGTIINKEVINFIKENNVAVLLSLDGPDNEFNLRKFKNGKSSVGLVLKNIKELKENGIFIELRATMINTNPYIFDTYDFFEKLELPFDIVFAYVSDNKTHDLASYSNGTINNIKAQYKKLLMYYVNKLINNEPIYNKVMGEMFSILRYRLKKRFACSAGLSYFTILSNGDIHSCAHLMNDPNVKIGNIDSVIISKKDYTPIPIEDINGCENCWAKNLCLGGCFAQKKSMGIKNTQALPKSECELQKIRWEFSILLYYFTMKEAPHYIKKTIKN